MTNEEVTAPGQAYAPPQPRARERFDAVIRAVSELILDLGSANAKAQFEEAVLLSRAIGRALSDAADILAELAALADLAERDDAVRKLVAMRRVANQQFGLAPDLSGAAKAGDRSALACEKRTWIEKRSPGGIDSPRNPRPDTQPEPVRVWTAMDADSIESLHAAADEDGMQ